MSIVSIEKRINYLLSLAKTEPYKFEKELEQESIKEIEEGKVTRETEGYEDAISEADYIVDHLTQKIEQLCQLRGVATGKIPIIVPITQEIANEIIEKFKQHFKVDFPIFEIIVGETFSGGEDEEGLRYFPTYNKNKILFLLKHSIDSGSYELPSDSIQFIDKLLNVNDIPDWNPPPNKIQIGEEKSKTKLVETALRYFSEKFPKCFKKFNMYSFLLKSKEDNIKKLYSSSCQEFLKLMENSNTIHYIKDSAYDDDDDLEYRIHNYIRTHIRLNIEDIYKIYGLSLPDDNKLISAIGNWVGLRLIDISECDPEIFEKINFYVEKVRKALAIASKNNHLLKKIAFELAAPGHVKFNMEAMNQILINLDSLEANDIINLISVSKNLTRTDSEGEQFKLEKFFIGGFMVGQLSEKFKNLNSKIPKDKFIKKLLSTYYGKRLYQLLTSSAGERVASIIEYMVNSWEKDINFAEKAGIIILQMPEKAFIKKNNFFDRIIRAIELSPPKNESEMLAMFNRIDDFIDLAHNNGSNNESIFDTIIKYKYDLKSDDVKKLITLIMKIKGPEVNDTFWEKFKRTCEAFEYNSDVELSNLETVRADFDSGKLTKDKSMVNRLSNIILNFELSEHLEILNPLRKDKDKRLFMLNYNVNNDLVFEVLPDKSIEHFQVGAETDCCQKMGTPGEEGTPGEDACIDSYINSLAGVLVLRHPSGIIAQSYFHYVPEDNGIILDNVEVNWKRARAAKIDLNAVYASLAKQVTKDYNLSYFRCGMQYNDLTNELFKQTSFRKDPRYFEHDASDQDFSYEKHIDLLSPNFVKETYKLSKQATSKMLAWIKFAKVNSLADTYYYNAKLAVI